ncbi:uncharacterized protein [Cicer arietinum]|uniref:E3 ubiquitin-protein ligase RING1a n=1 Tax=Cicer arietinum TaxID=3827 RepID=A0A1S2Z0J6_CICAR|nr:putative E3 ubiquitin-protein ligase RING1a [Cicer arietinum]
MSAIILRNISFTAHRFRLSHPLNSSLLSLSKHTSFFSSRIPHTHENNQQPLDVEEISNEELKRRVARLKEGDEEAIPSVFEAILQRYLTGKPIEADQDLMREILGKGEESKDDDEEDEDEDEDEFDSDLEGLSDSDLEEEENFDLDVKTRSRGNEEKAKRK